MYGDTGRLIHDLELKGTLMWTEVALVLSLHLIFLADVDCLISLQFVGIEMGDQTANLSTSRQATKVNPEENSFFHDNFVKS